MMINRYQNTEKCILRISEEKIKKNRKTFYILKTLLHFLQNRKDDKMQL